MKYLLIFFILCSVGVAAAQHPPGGIPTGLVNHRIHVATSQDGVNWQWDDTILRESTSVPTIAEWNGDLWIYAVNGTADEDFERLVALRQLADGSWQEQFINLEFDGRPVDPDALVLEDGRLRLYLYNLFAPDRRIPTQPGEIFSAVTEDGINFTLEDGVRFTVSPPASDPSVVQQDDGIWWLYVSYPDEDALIIARGDDGLTFEQAGRSSGGSIASTVRAEDGSLRQYACTRQGMSLRSSTDGLTWQAVATARLPRGCDPSVKQRADGTWVMVYKTIAPP